MAQKSGNSQKQRIALGSCLWLIFLLALAVGLAGCADKPPLPEYGVVPDFQLTDENGANFDSGQALKNKVWVADFIFTNCPGPCPRMSSQMHQVQTALNGASDVRFLSFTIDPSRDTPPVLAEYAKHFDADPQKWFFLTGPVEVLNRLGQSVFHLGEIDGKNLEHSTRFALVDHSGRIRGFYLSSDEEAVPKLIADAKRLLAESQT